MTNNADCSAAAILQNLYARRSLLALFLLLALLILIYLNPEWRGALDYQRQLLMDQPGRSVSHVLTHLNLQHLLLNGLLLVAIYNLFSNAFISLWWLSALCFSAACAVFGLYYYSGESGSYLGLGAALHGLFVYAVLRARASTLWLLAIIGKLAAEQAAIAPSLLANRYIEQLTGHAPIVDVYLWGAAGGFFFYGLIRSAALLLVIVELNKPDRRK